MKKRLKLIAIVYAVAVTMGIASCSSSRQGVHSDIKRPEPGQIQAALDSICSEGYNLYIAERVNWVATDMVLEHYSEGDFGGNVIWQPTDSTWRAVFFDKEGKNSVFELDYNSRSGESSWTYETRPVTNEEQSQWELKSVMFDNVYEQYRDSIRYRSDYGRLNFDLVRIDANTMRLYILQGVERPGVIPFGNDFSIDFDNEGKTMAFRRYHKSFIPMLTVDEEGNKTTATYHSHLRDNPYITPTDICNFLLYRNDEMKQTYIVSTALNGEIIYNAESNSAVFIPREVMEKIGKKGK
ncbi:MAG: hypothetical protein J6X86_01765 [Bacteroidales bacterium]|nr:hypothetical protein [Bacteroidales bacterium]